MVSANQASLLEALARYGYLTPNQILRLRIYRDKGSVLAALRTLAGKRLISSTERQAVYGKGSVPSVHTLTETGADQLGLASGTPVLALRGAKRREPPLDVEHRTAIVDVHIGLRIWAESAGHAVISFTADFERSAFQGRKATCIRTSHGDYTPDALALIEGADGIKRPLVIEVYRGGVAGRASYLLGKIPQDLRHFEDAALLDALVPLDAGNDWSRPRLLIVVSDERLRDSLLKSPPISTTDAWRATYIKTLAELFSNFQDGWWKASGQRESLF